MEGLKSHGGFFEAGLRSLWSFTAGALGAQPQWQPVPAGGGALQQPPTAPAREILLGVAGLSPTSLSPRAWQRGLCHVPSFKGSKEQHGDLARAQPVPGWGPMMPTLPACPQGWLSPSPWSFLHIPPVSPHVYSSPLSPSGAHSCSSLGGRRAAPGDMSPLPGSSPAVCHPQPQIKRADVLRPPAKMPAGREGKLRQEVRRSTVTQRAGSSVKRSFHHLICSF